MDRILTLTRDERGVHVDRDTLDQLWQEAQSLGDVKVNDKVFRDNGEGVHIVFQASSGSRIYAYSEHTEIREAFRRAIAEARRLGAGQ